MYKKEAPNQVSDWKMHDLDIKYIKPSDIDISRYDATIHGLPEGYDLCVWVNVHPDGFMEVSTINKQGYWTSNIAEKSAWKPKRFWKIKRFFNQITSIFWRARLKKYLRSNDL